MRFLAAFAVLLLALSPGYGAGGALAGDKSIIVLDASGSMWAKIDGRTKMSIAQDTLDEVLKAVPEGNEVGLMVYGHREKGSCRDIELAVPPAVGTAAAISKFARSINPKGKTPLTEAVREAAEALKYTEEKATVILVTDGLETCEADPCALANELEKQGVDFTAHVVGFGLSADEGKQVACLAENTGGKYFQASDASQLASALKQTITEVPKAPVEEPKPVPVPAPAPEFNVITSSTLSEGGTPLDKENHDVNWQFFKAKDNNEPDGESFDSEYLASYSTKLPEGRYVALATLTSSITRTIPFEVKTGEITRPLANFDAALLTITPKRTPQDAEPDGEASVKVSFGDYTTTSYGRTKLYVAAGTVKMLGTLGPVTAEDTLTTKGGETLEHDLIIGSGVLVNKAVYGDNGPDVDSTEIFFEVVSPTKDINGTRKSFNYTYGTGSKLDTPTGDLVLSAKLGSAHVEVPISIQAGERKEVTVNLNAGVLDVLAADADRIVVVSATKDIQGAEKEISYGFGPEHKDTVPAGEYRLKLTFKGDKAPEERPLTIKAGERTEIKID